MKTRYKINPLFTLNLGIVVFFSIGAAYFTIIPMIMWEISFDRIISGVTQNYAMIGLWLFYFASIAFLPISFKKNRKTWKIAFGIFVSGIIVFALFITGIFSCWESEILKFFGTDYNARLRC